MMLSLNLCRKVLSRHGRAISTRATSGKVLPLNFLTGDEEATKEAVARFSKERVAPIVREMEQKEAIDDGLLKEMFDNGFLGVMVPEEYGGSGASLMSAIVSTEEFAKVEPAISLLFAVHVGLVCTVIEKLGTKEQKEQYLPRLVKDSVGSFCLSEATSGSDAFAMKTIAKPDGDDFLINGSKMWISSSDKAEVFIVFANADPSRGYRGITAFILDRSMPGLSIGPREKKLGMKCSGTCSVNFDNVRVPKSKILGELYKGYQYAAGSLNESRTSVAAQMIGLSQGCLDIGIQYTLERKQFGQSVYDFQGLQHEAAKLATKLEMGRLMVYNTARMFEQGLPIVKEAAMAKYYASELAQKITRKSIDWMGGVGFTPAYLAEKFYRDCKVGTIYEGTSLIQLNTIAKYLKKEYSS